MSGPWVALEDGQATTQDDSLAETPKDLSSDTAIEPEHISSETPRSFVFRGELFIYAANWLKENWFLGIAALSLALAGVFTVQYGVE